MAVVVGFAVTNVSARSGRPAPEPSTSSQPHAAAPHSTASLKLPALSTSGPASRGSGGTTDSTDKTKWTPSPSPRSFHSRQFTVLGAGDVLLHSGFWSQAAKAAQRSGKSGYDFDPLFAPVSADVKAADLAICHLETPLGDPNGPFTGYPVFKVPPQVTTALRHTGYDDCDTASNHSLDGGQAGVNRTLAALDAAGITHTGSARTAAEAARIDLLQVAGVPVAHLAYTFSFNGFRLPKDKPWLANQLDVPRILADAHRAKQAGAQVVIVSLHWGTEYQHAPNSAQLSQAKTLLASPDIDLILGCHAHVVQPMERIGGKWVVYGMGNEVAWQTQRQDTRDGFMARFTFTEVAPGRFRVTKAEAIPTFMWLPGGSARLVNLPDSLANSKLSASQRAAYRSSWQRTRGYLLSRGAGAAGLVVIGS